MRPASFLPASFLLAAAISQPAAAEAIAIPFAPPTGMALTYRIDQHRPVAGQDSLFRAVRRLRFERAGSGYMLYATLQSIDTDAPASGAEPYRAALGPLVGVEMRFRLDGKGRIVALEDMDAVWTSVQTGLAAMLTTFPSDSSRYKAAARVQALFAGLLAEGRLALLAGELQPLFLFSGSDVADGPGRGLRTMAGSPLGKPVEVEGTLKITAQTPARLALEEKLAGEGVQVAVRYGLSRQTGIVEEQERTLVAGALAMKENRSLTAAK
ncbi:hypothetical protein [Sphingobium sp. CCH11-B1]|uniref:hypothetical protein n=1 Tax=Sphingobium sp. CCH11-B1 TaxID=1768781 RepID=UPI000B18A955|nr:hypothetical protein [Sphingobium sp. CCH11-B1]MEA3388883.1 hypothetical protein [Pseudomonadota bacterium]